MHRLKAHLVPKELITTSAMILGTDRLQHEICAEWQKQANTKSTLEAKHEI
jgi:hypothetical protein